MAYDQSVGTVNIRKQVIDGTLKQVIPKKYVFRQALNIVSTSGWKNTFWREDPSTLTGATTSGITRNSFKEISRGAAFPNATVAWEEVHTRILKFGAEDVINWEDVLSDNIDVEQRTITKIAEGIASAEDAYIWDGLAEITTPSVIQSFALTNVTYWEGSSAAIIDDLMRAKQMLKDYSYPTDNVLVFINQRDERSIVKWVTDKGAQFNSISQETALNGQVPGLAGFKFIVSPNVTTSMALVCIPKTCGTLAVLEPLKTMTKDDEGKSRLIRAWEQVTFQLTEPKAVVLIKGTRGWGA